MSNLGEVNSMGSPRSKALYLALARVPSSVMSARRKSHDNIGERLMLTRVIYAFRKLMWVK